jgi:hypothetical protein
VISGRQNRFGIAIFGRILRENQDYLFSYARLPVSGYRGQNPWEQSGYAATGGKASTAWHLRQPAPYIFIFNNLPSFFIYIK